MIVVMLFRCRICGDPYIGDSPPGRCPHCGALQKEMVKAKEYKENFDVELNEKDKANVQRALEVEISNASFYYCAAEKAENEETMNLFKALAKIEAEHASIWRKILKLPKEALPKSDECSEMEIENLKESHKRETNAISFYKQAASESTNPRVKEIFQALVEVETDHLHLSEKRI